MLHANKLSGIILCAAVCASAHAGASLQVCVQNMTLADLGETPVEFVLDVPPGAVVTGASVSIRLTHEWIGDVVVFMEHDNLLTRLLDRPGNTDFPFGCGGTEIDVLVTDTPAGGGLAPCSPSNPQLIGELAPLDAFSFYEGLDASGVWKITFRDVHAFDGGTIDEVCLNVSYEATQICAGDCDGSGTVDFNDLVAMLFEFGGAPVNEACDADASGGVDFNDLVSAIFLFGPCP